MTSPPLLHVTRLAPRLNYAAAYAAQLAEHAARMADTGRTASLLLVEHAPVYTLGRATLPGHLTVPEAELAARTGAEVVRADRGGSVTYHGPGQVTAYLILNLRAWGFTIHQHLWNLEETALGALRRFGLSGERAPRMTGAWVGGAKVCAIGVGCRRWVTYHGLCLNVDLDLAPFAWIDPCGLGRRPVTSLARLLARPVTPREAEEALVAACGETLGAQNQV